MLAYLYSVISPIVDPFVAGDWWPFILRFMPFVIFYELPHNIFILTGIFKYVYMRRHEGPRVPYYPFVSCIVTCYSEGLAVRKTVESLSEQIYPGKIQIIVMVDGAADNIDTMRAAESTKSLVASRGNRSLLVVPKWKRGGRVSNINTGFNYARGEIIMVLDGDTSFDNNMVERATRHFADKTVAAVSGCLSVRNADSGLAAALQAVEYFITIQATRAGLSAFNVVNNISGAFGVFRRSTVNYVDGWDAGTAEDFDMTMRIKQYFGRYKDKVRIVFDAEAMGYTDVPDTFKGYFRQRIRWDGDLSYIYFKKHRKMFSHKLLGWPNYLMLIFTGLYAQIVVPLIISVYTVWLFSYYPLYYVTALLIVVYIYYLVVLFIDYFVAIACVSERPKDDFLRLPLLFIFPFFAFASRVNSMIATVYEMTAQGHKETSMAPWWVTKKNKF